MFRITLAFSLCTSLATGLALSTRSAASSPQDADVYYVTQMSDRFLDLMSKHEQAVNAFSDSELERLRSAMVSARSSRDKELLEVTARQSEENRLEAQNAFNQMRNFANTLKQAFGAATSTSSCQDLTCGAHAYCRSDHGAGARCLCKDGYQGNGFVCKTAMNLASHALMQASPGESPPSLADLNAHTLEGDTIIAVFRDRNNGDRGYALIGHASPNGMSWHAPVLFSNDSPAFDPVVVQLQEGSGKKGGIAIAYRTADRGGDGVLLGGQVDHTTGQITFGKARAFAHHQAQAMAMLSLTDSRVAVAFAEHIVDDNAKGLGAAMYGATLLAKVHSDGQAPEVVNKDRFASGPIARLSATALSPSLFALAYRQGDVEPGNPQAEAACIAGQVHHNQLVFNTPAVLLEPEKTNIWSRSLTHLGDNLLSYTYHSGDEKLTKQTILRVNPQTHRLSVVRPSEVIAHGFAPAVGSVALLPTLSDENRKNGPFSLSLVEQHRQRTVRFLTYTGHTGTKSAHARLCHISSGVPTGCQEFVLAGRDFSSGSGTQLSDGRFLFLFTDAKGAPFYEFIGLGVS